ncbi:hypothetical protein QA599_11970 [Haloarculaceae archaeon H-GB1-1]|nr:hypothetical protein [Haloarculaceae archaeon H-GB1-1]
MVMPTPLFNVGTLEPFIATRLLAYGTVVVAGATLLYYLFAYVRFVLAAHHGRGWWYVGIGIGAGMVYGVSGLLDLVTAIPWLRVVTRGGALFFILFLSLGIRAMYVENRDSSASNVRTPMVDYAVFGGVVLAWWIGFLSSRLVWISLVETIGWGGATLWVFRYGVLTVRAHEGTSFAAVVRHLLPAVISFVIVVFSDLVGIYTLQYAAVVDAVWVIGTVLVAAFLFNTAVAIRHQGAEVERKYDWTTWRG